MHADEQVFAGEAAPDLLLMGRNRERIGVLDQHRLDRRTVLQRVRFARQDGADARLVEAAHARIPHVQAFDHRLAQLENAAVAVERAAALVRPGAGHRRDRERRMHVDRAVALAREAVAEAEEGPLCRADERGEGFDLRDLEAGDRRRPGRVAAPQMRFEFGRRVGKAREIVAVGEAVAKEDVHDGAGERAVRAGPQAQSQIGLPHRLGLVDVDGDDLCAARLPGADGVGHHVDLGRDRVGPPDDDTVRLFHFAGVGADQGPRAGDIARPGDPDADRAVEARVALGVGQALDPVAHHEAHRAGVEIGPDAFGPEPPLGLEKGRRDAVERFVPSDRGELSRALGPDPHERFRQPVGVVDPLAVAGDFRAYHPRGVGLVRRAADASDPRSRNDLDVERANRRAVVRADGRLADDLGRSVHANFPRPSPWRPAARDLTQLMRPRPVRD